MLVRRIMVPYFGKKRIECELVIELGLYFKYLKCFILRQFLTMPMACGWYTIGLKVVISNL